MIPFDLDAVLATFQAVRDVELPDASTVANLTNPKKKKLLQEVDALRIHLTALEQCVDGVIVPSYVFDLSNPVTVGEMIAYKISQTTPIPLSSLGQFYGAGVYMLYYRGKFGAYESISGSDCPIYVGSASPKDKIADSPRKQDKALYSRLSHHLNKSIRKANSTLDASDFDCRYLVVQSGLELAAEQFLLRRYEPVWNKEMGVCPGFGKHGDKSDRQSELSKWDILHPGRPFAGGQNAKKQAESLRATATAATLKQEIQKHYLSLLDEDRAKWSGIFNPAWVAKQPVSSS